MDEFFKIDGGDGDQNFFSTLKLLKRIDADWFGGLVEKEEAVLFEIINWTEDQTFNFVAVTSRMTMNVEDQLEHRNLASVIVYGIKYENRKFPEGEYAIDGIGMSVLEYHPSKNHPKKVGWWSTIKWMLSKTRRQ